MVICCYEEEKIILDSWDKLKKVLPSDYEVVLVNDGSTDKTADKLYSISANDKNIKVIDYTPNKGYGFALRQALASVTGDYIITMDADLAMDPGEVITSCLKGLEHYDMVICSRYLGVQADYPLRRRIASWGYRTLNKFLFGISVQDTQSGFIGFKRKVNDDIKLKSNSFSALLELITKTHRSNYSIQEIPVKFVHQTVSGETSVFKNAPKMLLDCLKVYKEVRNYDKSRTSKRS